ncbi:hypothetical protein ILUMI_14295 [Ignelater luminosus]|uniref:Small lysine-rich protein 1 n=1 Tax=Ignelater luminosus TaxID=2038154 RepID=A0A8K0CSQ2_IGNLU|nr:hypothetical protein ILUMI_14295 [Ignelater luminosus]
MLLRDCMAGKKKKKGKNGKNGNAKKPKKASKKGGGGSGGGRAKSARYTVDIFTEAAMENAYTTCHNVQDLLRWRGFPWPDAQKKKKKGKK